MDSKEIYVISKDGIPRTDSSNSLNGGILKTSKVSTHPAGKKAANGKKVRHELGSQVSMDSTFDASELELPVSRRTQCQRRLSILLHTHVVLIVVCTLAALDAVCVIGQLICDILIMREKLDHFEQIEDELTGLLFEHIPHLNESIHEKWNLDAILAVLTGRDIHTDQPAPTPPSGNNSISIRSSFNGSIDGLPPSLSSLLNVLNAAAASTSSNGVSANHHHRVRRAAPVEVPGHEVDHGILYDLTHTFHLGSMVILSLLLLETLFKVFAMGTKLRHHKLEVFDAIVVAVSWSLDVAFWEGIWAHPGTTAATLLIYLLPWRVVRIVNSFVLVIQEKDHVQLKIVKQRLRQSMKKSKEYTDKASSYRHEVKALAGLCRKMGATDAEITACSPSGKAGRRGSIHSVLERAASLTFISTMSSVGSLPSLFDMGDASSDEDNNGNNNHKPLDRNSSQAPTLRSAFSSSTLDSNSEVFMESEIGVSGENRSLDNSSAGNVSPKTTGGPKEEGYTKKRLRAKLSVERTSSNDSAPPSYHIAVSESDNNTRL